MRRKTSNSHRTWTLIAGVSGALVSLASHQLLRRGWSAWRKSPPPRDPTAPDVTWKDALLWAGATGVVVAIGRVVAKRGAAAGWRIVTGRRPPV